MKYINMIALWFCAYLIPPFHLITPFIIMNDTYTKKEWIIMILGMSTTYLMKGFWNFYFLVILFLLYFIFHQIMILKGKSLQKGIQIYSILLFIIASYYYDYNYEFIILGSISIYKMIPFLRKRKEWIFLILPCLISSPIQIPYIYAYLLAMSICYGKEALYCLSLLYFSIFDLSYLILFLGCMLFHQQKKETLLLICGSLFFLPHRIYATIMVLPSIFLLMIYEFSKEEHHYQNTLIQSILYMLIDFYEERNHDIYTLLKAFTRVFSLESVVDQKIYDLSLLCKESGYQVQFSKDSNQYHLQCHIVGMSRGDICSSFLSFISNYFQQKYEIIDCDKMIDGYHVFLQMQSRFTYEYDAISVAKQEESGDVYRMIYCNDDMIVLLCDGMGNGSLAKSCASFAIRLFQRLCHCGMAMDEMIYCINAFMQSERFTTMDVLRLSSSHDVAQSVKSAACPTLLYRNGEIMELNSHALPIGMLSSLEVDIQSFSIQDDDVLFIMSDGFNIDLIKDWIMHHQFATPQGFRFMKKHLPILQDDATMIKIHVRENKQASCNL